MNKIIKGILTLSLLTFISSSLAEEAYNQESGLGFNSERLNHTVKSNKIFAFRIELGKLLEDPSYKFLKAIHDRDKKQEFDVLKLIYINSLFLQTRYQEGWKQEGENFLRALIPPIWKTDRDGISAYDKALSANNTAAAAIFRKYKKIQSDYELHEDNTDNVWRNHIPKIFLEDTALGKALLEEDLSDFQSAAISLAEEPAGRFLALFHNRTRQGDTIFHLIAKVKSERAEFASTFEALMDKLLYFHSKKIRVGSKGIYLFLYRSWLKEQPSSVEEAEPTADFSKLAQAVKENSIAEYHQELKRILKETPSLSFAKIAPINTNEENVFNLMAAETHRAKALKRPLIWVEEYWSLIFTVIPPIHKQNKEGKTALDIARQENNIPAQNFFRKYAAHSLDYDLYKNDQEEPNFFSRHIPKTDLENTALGKALMQEDLQAFQIALNSLAEEPAKNILIIFHNKTKQGDTIFHLAAKVKTHQKEFMEALTKLLYHFLPQKKSMLGKVLSKFSMIKNNSSSKLDLLLSSLAFTGGVLSINSFEPLSYVLIGASLLYGGGLCYDIFSKKNIEKKDGGEG